MARPAPIPLAPRRSGPVAAVLAGVTLALGAVAAGTSLLVGADTWAARSAGSGPGTARRGLAEGVSALVRVRFVVAVALLLALLAGLALRRLDAVVLCLVAPLATRAAELLLKPVFGHLGEAVGPVTVAGARYSYPAGHVAIVATCAVLALLVLRAGRVRPALLGPALAAGMMVVALVAWSRVVLNAHFLSDAMGGAATGVAVTLGSAVAIEGLVQRRDRLKARARPTRPIGSPTT